MQYNKAALLLLANRLKKVGVEEFLGYQFVANI